jgi:hypothetical protein
MFRSDRDALAQEVDDLRAERERLRHENEAMRNDLLARRREVPPSPYRPNVYKEGAAHLSPGERAALTRHEVVTFPPWAAVLLHFFTFGIFPLVHFSSLHERLPRAEHDDPSAGKAIGYSFIPYYNLYWIIFNTLRLTDRINLQFRLRGLPDAIPRGLLLVAGIFSVVPYLNFIIGFPILWPIAIYYLQRGVNQLAELPQDGAPPDRVPRLRAVRVHELPGPDDAAAQREAEAVQEAEMARRASLR